MTTDKRQMVRWYSWILLLIALACAVPVDAAPAIQVKIVTDRPDAIYEVGQQAQFAITVTQDEPAYSSVFVLVRGSLCSALLFRSRFKMSGVEWLLQRDITAAAGRMKMPSAYHQSWREDERPSICETDGMLRGDWALPR